MKKYFITSDVHSFYTPLINALTEVGFDVNNPEHILIVDGDLFDRGEETVEVYNFIKSIPKDRRILIRGNHEYLLKSLVKKDLPQSYDISNGTVSTIFQFCGCIPPKIDWTKDFTFKNKMEELYFDIVSTVSMEDYYDYRYSDYDWEERKKLVKRWQKVVNKFNALGIIEWIDSDEWIDYYELGNLVITHAFIPVDFPAGTDMYRPSYELLHYIPNWRELPRLDFEYATWGCPYKLYDAGLFDKEKENGKILVCGHWHTFDFRQHYDNIYYRKTEDFDNSLFYRENLIALDACTVLSKFVNVLVVEDGKLYYTYKK